MANLQPEASSAFRDRRHDALGKLRVLPDELVCSILENLCPRDVARLSCVSSVMYILCNEEPLWMSLCLKRANGQLQYKGSWKKTTLYLENVPVEHIESERSPLCFDGFNSLFLYKRMYRCHTALDGFCMDSGNVERKANISLEEFDSDYDGKMPVIINGLVDAWPARTSWTMDELFINYGEKAFRISQKSARKITMKLKDYVSYINIQHDEDPLYIFEDKFGEIAPSLLKDYNVPQLFQEDWFDVLDGDQRPPFRWLIIGPQRSGASWHVDPALTSAWNTLLCGRKRWALYPPGKVPLGVTVHVNDEDGDVNIESPSSLQWWLDYYPLLADEDKPIECTQLPGETIFLPSGWWHCVLNLETTVAVTQNFVNPKNFEFVCLDMAPGYHHKGVCRAGFLALDDGPSEEAGAFDLCRKDDVRCSDLTRKEKRMKIQQEDGLSPARTTDVSPRHSDLQKQEFFYDTDFLAMFLDKDKDHYSAPWSSGNCIGPRDMREWLYRLWVGKPGMRELIWKGACLALNADKWFDCLKSICLFHNLPHPTEDQRLPVGMGSNPVFLMDDQVVKIFVEGGLENSLYCLGTELEFYALLCELNSSLRNYVPQIMASGIVYLENGSFMILPWDGRGLPKVIAECNLLPSTNDNDSFPFGLWNKKQYELRRAGKSPAEMARQTGSSKMWPYIITKRCKGKMFAQLRDTLSWTEARDLASFLGEQLHNLHLLPLPALNSEISDIGKNVELKSDDFCMDSLTGAPKISPQWEIFIKTLSRKKIGLNNRLRDWGDPIPDTLIKRVDEYLPDDVTKFFSYSEDEADADETYRPSWIHSDIMDDNIHMESCSVDPDCKGRVTDEVFSNGCLKAHKNETEEEISWRPGHILDFSDLTIGDPLYDVIPIYLDVFRGDTSLLEQFLQSYKLPLSTRTQQHASETVNCRRLSYRAMCYCILHDENVLGAIFSIWKELRKAETWEEVEKAVWGVLNSYSHSSLSLD